MDFIQNIKDIRFSSLHLKTQLPHRTTLKNCPKRLYLDNAHNDTRPICFEYNRDPYTKPARRILIEYAGQVYSLKIAYAACWHVGHAQSSHAQLAQESLQCAHSQTAWLHVGQVQLSQVQFTHRSEQLPQEHTLHSS